MKKILTVRVTQEDIERGLPDSCVACPIAKALRRATHKKYSIQVDGPWTSIGGTSYVLPRAAMKFIDRFDQGKSVKPFTFDMRASNE